MSVEVLTKSIRELREMVEERLKPTAVHEGKNALSYFIDDDDAPRMKGLRADYTRRRQIELPEGYKPYTVWKSFGQMLREGIRSYHPEAGGNDARRVEFANKYGSIYKSVQGLSMGTGAEGGFAVLPEFSPKIHDRIWDNDLISRIDQYTVVGNRMVFPRVKETSRATGSRAGGLQAYWVDEAQTMTGSKPKLAETELKLKKLAIVV